jgi:hypothetical protein
MAIKPILFNTEMVRAIMDGRKSCTRRMVKPQPDEKHTYPLGFVTDSTEKKEVGCFGFGINEYGGSIQYAKPQYQPGDLLYVRETFIQAAARTFWYKADDNLWIPKGLHWKPSIHMPKEAARIWLKVTNVRVERLQDMTDDDAEAEGCFDYTSTALGFPDVWDSTIKKSDLDSYGWNANPWVWVIEFERCEPQEGQNV